jgi:trehalose-phosphatase
VNDIIVRIDNKQLVVFLDYDGTLTPIVDRPELAVLTKGMRETLKRLTRVCTTAVISGRALAEVKQLVGLTEIFYAGNHGLQITGPDYTQIKYEQGFEYLDAVTAAYDTIQSRIGHIDGILIEQKQFSLSVHYRLVADSEVPCIEAAVDDVIANESMLRKHHGKKVFEIRPRIDWDKGKALRWLMQALDMDLVHFIPLYIGDDVTDEDAFNELAADGVGILVAQEDQLTHAAYRLDNPSTVEQFLNQLVDKLEKQQL